MLEREVSKDPWRFVQQEGRVPRKDNKTKIINLFKILLLDFFQDATK